MARPLLALALVALLLPGCLGGPSTPDREEGYEVVKVAEGFNALSQVAFAPDGRIFLAERLSGDVRVLRNGTLDPEPWAHVDVTNPGGYHEQGLLGLTLHPRFGMEPWVYLYYSYDADGRSWNRVVRLREAEGRGGTPEVLLDRIPGSKYHDGGVLAFGPDGMLWITTGEAHERGPAQDRDSVMGKILRLTPEGDPAPGGPFGSGNPAYTMGHRNVYGLAFDAQGRAWITENGPNVNDEVNLLEAGANYGWPEVTGAPRDSRFRDAAWVWRAPIAVTGIQVAGPAYGALEGDLIVGDYVTKNLRRLQVEDSPRIVAETSLAELPEGITDVETAPDGTIHVVTPTALYRLAVKV
ncbi:MAG TPA: PQQ-dependent sugar dehydrogenase [Candidatus Thermoplasmatota archaeon]|nr:PQQ-dependent sugar dehydrogenase [Candidatus Thermoplasmatota archaeon]